MSTLAELITALEADLRDAANVEWTDAELTAHIRRALEEVSARRPRRVSVVIPTLVDQHLYDLSTAAPAIITVLEVFYPYDPLEPYIFTAVQWAVPEDATLWIGGDDPVADGTDNIYLRYLAHHTIDDLDAATATTLDAAGERLVLLGASGYAVQQLAYSLVGTITVDKAAAGYAAWARARLEQYHEALDRYTSQIPAITDPRVTWTDPNL